MNRQIWGSGLRAWFGHFNLRRVRKQLKNLEIWTLRGWDPGKGIMRHTAAWFTVSWHQHSWHGGIMSV